MRVLHRSGAGLVLLLAASRVAGADVRFVDVAAEVGLVLRNVSGGDEAKWTILESTGSGACFLDVEGDGDLDVYVVNGGTLADSPSAAPVRDALYLNDGRGRFTDATSAAGLHESEWGGGCAAGDYDNDGDPDLYVTNFGRDALLRNQGDGTFRDVTAAAGIGDRGWGVGAAFFDADRDGDLDLYVANYVRLDIADPEVLRRRCRWKGGEVYCGPNGFEGDPDVLYRNRGDGTFEDASAAAGVGRDSSYGMGVVAGDVDGDGDTDLFVANDTQANFLLVNDGAGRFADAALPAGVAFSVDGRAQAGMGADLGDADGDGDEDLFITHFSDDYHTLYRNEGGLAFTDVTASSGLDAATRSSLGWGGGFFDYDNDGDLDLFVAGGHVFPDVERFDPATSYRQRNLLFENDGRGHFAEVAAAGALAVPGTGRGAAFGDWDDDGDLDVLVVQLDAPPALLRNDGGNDRAWLKLRLLGRRSNRDGIGARVRLTAGGRTQVREMRWNASYASTHDPRLHFGLGSAPSVELLEVRWPSGGVQQARGLPAGHLVTLDEDEGIVSTVPLAPRGPLAPSPPPGAAAEAERPRRRLPEPSGERLDREALRRVDGLARQGMAQVAAGRLAEGIAAYEGALVLLPPWAAASQSADALGFGDRERYRSFLASLYSNLGVALMRAERVDECAEPIERALSLAAGRGNFHYNLGLCHFHGGRYADAISAFEASARAPAPLESLPYDLGRALVEAGRCAEGEPMLRRAIGDLPRPDTRGREAEAWYHLGGCQADAGRLAEAAAAFRSALAVVPGHQRALYRLATAWRRSGRAAAGAAAESLFAARQPADEAVRALKRRGVRDSGERVRLARAYLDAGVAPQAVQEAQKVLAGDPRSVDALVLLGDALLALRPPALAAAEDAFARALAVDRRLPPALAGMGETLRRAGRPEEAERWLRRALESRPDDGAAAAALARLEATAGRPEAAASRMQAILDREPGDPRALRALAEVFVVAAAGPWRRPEEALRLLDRAGGNYGEGLDVRVKALRLAGRDDEAGRLLEESPVLSYASADTSPR
jgi:tetratricopeptide (TPR) repeat protein